METRRLGESELEVTPIVLGAWAIGGFLWGGRRDAEAQEAIAASIAAGATTIDTAPIYGFGHSEELVGRTLAELGMPAAVRVCTKVGLVWDDERGKLAFEGPDDQGASRKVYFNLRPDSVRRECDASLRRLGVERIDLLQCHWPDPTTPVPETMGALAELVGEGKVGAIGVSNFPPALMDEARAALSPLPLASDQPRYNLVRRDIEADVLPYAREHRVGLIVYSPIEQGLLAGAVPAEREFPESDLRSRRDSFQRENRAKINACVREHLVPLGRAHGVDASQTALAWILAQPGISAAICGARNALQARSNAAAAAVELSPAELERIGDAFDALELELDRQARR